MRLDPSYLDFLTKEQFRVLVAIEMGMKNHQYVPAKLINSIANLKTGDAYKIIKRLLKLKFINHVSIKYDGYKLNYSGYDYLALQTFVKRGTITQVVGKLGVGKESDIYTCYDAQGNPVVLKFARLGRTSFMTVKNNRDYIGGRTSYNWLYLSRISSTKEYLYMQTLHKAGFPTPVPLDWNRHGIVMSFIDGATLTNIVQVEDCEKTFKQTLNLLVKFAQNGLIHSDFNEFNLMLDYDSKAIRVIDFPQCVSTSHKNAEFYFNRDVDCIYTYFDKLSQKCQSKGFNVVDHPMPQLEDIQQVRNLDMQVRASGHLDKIKYSQVDMKQFQEYEEFLRKLKRNDKTQAEQINQDEEDEFVTNLQGQTEQDFQNDNFGQMNTQLEHQVKQLKNESDEQNQQSNEQQQDQQQQQVQQRFKGKTQFQIRQILKQEKLKQRAEKKKEKEQKNTIDKIKQIVRKKPQQHKRINHNKNKGLNKVNPNEIEY